MEAKTTHRDKFLLGRTRSHRPRTLAYVAAEVRLGKLTGTFPTVEHTTVTDPVTLAISFAVGFRPGDGDVDWDPYLNHWGQVSSGDRKIVRPPLSRKFDVGERDGYDHRHSIDVLWREWHNNGLQAGCVHQHVTADALRRASEDPNVYLGNHVKPCPLTGYRYGSQWLIKPLTDAAMERIATLELTPVK